MTNKYNYTNLPVLIWREGSYFIAYTPSVDLSVQARTKMSVQKRFTEAVNLFLEEIHTAGTIDDVLTELGWIKKPSKSWEPPKIVEAPSALRVAVPA